MSSNHFRDRISRRRLVIASAVLIAVAASVGSAVRNSSYTIRAAEDTALIRTGADSSTFIEPGNLYDLTVPIRNDSPYAVSVTKVNVIYAPSIKWDGASTVIQPDSTVYLRVVAPKSCPGTSPATGSATPSPTATAQKSNVKVYVNTVDGKSHGIYLYVYGAFEYAAQRCFVAGLGDSVGS